MLIVKFVLTLMIFTMQFIMWKMLVRLVSNQYSSLAHIVAEIKQNRLLLQRQLIQLQKKKMALPIHL